MKNITLLLILATFTCFSQIEENLLLHYKFDENTLDQTENEFHGISYGVTFVDDRFGNENSAAYFNGIDSYINLPNVPALKPQLPVSFSFWIKYDSSDYRDRAVFNTSFEKNRSSGIFFNSQESTGKFGIGFGDGTPSYNPETRRSYTSNMEVVNDEWLNIIVVAEGPLNMKIYINCEEHGGTYDGSGGELFYSSTPGSLGRHDRKLTDPPNYFKGSLDDFMYWDRALTQKDINSICENLGTPQLDRTSITLYPNPTSNIVFISGNIESKTTVNVYDVLGKLMLSKPYQKEMDLSSLSSGLYFLKFINGESITTKKVIIR